MLKPYPYLRAGALLMTLSLSVITALLIALFMMLMQYRQQYSATHIRKLELAQNQSSAIQLLLSRTKGSVSDTLITDLYDTGRDSALLIHRTWGIFDIGSVCVWRDQDSLSSTFLMGAAIADSQRYALYLKDEQRPLSISGRTHIAGDAFLPGAGIRKAHIENRSYAFKQTIHQGALKTSRSELPDTDKNRLELLLSLRKSAMTDASTQAENLPYTPMDHIQPFTKNIRYRYASAPLLISQVTLSGQVMILADSTVTIAADAMVDNLLVMAPSIIIEPGFQGRLQAYASDSIRIGRNSKLRYPSAVGLIDFIPTSADVATQPSLLIDSSAVVEGVVFSYFPNQDDFRIPEINISTASTVYGQVYADGYLALSGSVYGTTTARRFSLQTPASRYDNFVLDGVMDVTRLSAHYTGSMLFNRSGEPRLMLWLNQPSLPDSIPDYVHLLSFLACPMLLLDKMKSQKRKQLKSSTLVEILVAMVLITLLAAISAMLFVRTINLHPERRLAVYLELRQQAQQFKLNPSGNYIPEATTDGLLIELFLSNEEADSNLLRIELYGYMEGYRSPVIYRELIQKKP